MCVCVWKCPLSAVPKMGFWSPKSKNKDNKKASLALTRQQKTKTSRKGLWSFDAPTHLNQKFAEFGNRNCVVIPCEGYFKVNSIFPEKWCCIPPARPCRSNPCVAEAADGEGLMPSGRGSHRWPLNTSSCTRKRPRGAPGNIYHSSQVFDKASCQIASSEL